MPYLLQGESMKEPKMPETPEEQEDYYRTPAPDIPDDWKYWRDRDL
jgi:hypothetical protein